MNSNTMDNPAFSFPPEYWFPPFFTMQDNATTRYHQLTRWRAFVLDYCRHHRIFRISPVAAAAAAAEMRGAGTFSDASKTSIIGALFYNAAIDRGLSAEAIVEVLVFMRRKGSAERIGPGDDAGGVAAVVSGGGDGREKDVHWIYWKTPAEWAVAVEAWVRETAQEGVVFTLFELTQGDATEGTDFHGMEPEILRKALNVLVREGRATVFGGEDSLGVKFNRV